MGSETSVGIRSADARNCVSDSGNQAPIRFKTQPSRGGVVENMVWPMPAARSAIFTLKICTSK
jgi:polygalacturonase